MPPAEAPDKLGDALRPAGLDLVAPLSLAAYNARVPAAWRVPIFGREDALGLVVGNTRALWAPFTAALRADPRRAEAAHPLDAYVRDAVAAAVRFPCDVRWASDAPPRGVALLHAAEAAGLLWRSPSGLGVHPVFGPWVALRALLIVDAPPPAVPAPAAPCGHCEGACGPAFAALCVEAAPHAQAVESSWRAWVAMRDACPRGREHRYGEAQIRYHYLKDRAVLRAMVSP